MHVRRYQPMKSILDSTLATLGLFILFPVMVVVALAIFLDDPGPVIFRQTRAGRRHVPFTIYKFRTMKLSAPNVSTEEMRLLNLSPYTRLGPLLRRTSLDELPQLFNVLQGQMSLVGPRPALMSQEVVLRGREQTGADVLRPGVTGLAQITGRDDLPDHEKIAKDTLYLQNMSVVTDCLILLYTVRGVFKARGAY